MGDKSAIQWTDATWNPVTGCSKVSAGCKNCYAEDVAARFWATQYPELREVVEEKDSCGYPVKVTLSRKRCFTDVMTHEDRLDQPLRWRKPRRVFVNSMSDLFHEDVPDAFIDRVFAVMALAPQHTFQILTKRAERMRDYMTRFCTVPMQFMAGIAARRNPTAPTRTRSGRCRTCGWASPWRTSTSPTSGSRCC
jgi:protein gp37